MDYRNDRSPQSLKRITICLTRTSTVLYILYILKAPFDCGRAQYGWVSLEARWLGRPPGGVEKELVQVMYLI